MEYDITTKTKMSQKHAPAEITSNTTTFFGSVDLQGGRSVSLFVKLFDETDGNYQVILEESDDNSVFNDVALKDITGTDGLKTLVANGANQDVFGYIGKKQFIKIKIISTGVTTGSGIYAVVVQGDLVTTAGQQSTDN